MKNSAFSKRRERERASRIQERGAALMFSQPEKLQKVAGNCDTMAGKKKGEGGKYINYFNLIHSSLWGIKKSFQVWDSWKVQYCEFYTIW